MTDIAIPVRYNEASVIERRVWVIECAICSIDFGIGEEFMARRRKDHRDFYCPNGHSNVYLQDNTEERLRKQLATAETRERLARDSERFYRDQAATTRRSAAAVKGHLTRLRNRIAAGVCPCCQRSFENVRRHIEGQHPEWAAEHATAMEAN